MRISRKLYLPQSGGAVVHKIWRAHNKDFLLRDSNIRDLYLDHVSYALNHKSVNGSVKLHAYCVMSNHVHQIVSYRDESKSLSTFMRIAHGVFGQRFNRLNHRQGAVAYDRPKTPLIQPNDYHLMRVHFYIEANPIRAGLVKNLKYYRHSSYKYYAYGIEDKYSKDLTPPQWYLRLGKTKALRQKKYRELFEKYLKETRIKDAAFTKLRFIGDTVWIFNRTDEVKECIKTTVANLIFKPPN